MWVKPLENAIFPYSKGLEFSYDIVPFLILKLQI